MLSNSIRLFRIRGIEVGVHYSWLIVFALVTWSLADDFSISFPGRPNIESWLLGAIVALLLFASVLIHELAHSFVALARGLEARSITLFIFGGVSNLGGEAKKPSTEFVVAAVGPLTSFIISGIAFVVAQTVTEPRIEATASYLALINFTLAVFNLIPGFPLDGGRVFRSLVWSATGDLRKATDLAANLGKLVAYGFLAFGVLRIIDRDFIGGVWIAVIGWFLHAAASSTQAQVVIDTRLKRVLVGEVMRPDTTAVSPDLSVERLIDDVLLAGNRRAVPVAIGDRLIGMVTIGDLMTLPHDQRRTARVGDIMGGRTGVVTISPADTVASAIEVLGKHEFEQLPVVQGERLVGILTRADVMRQLQLREALDV
ncbi:MAG: site-2 protease family protein [Candidatus Limnocylindrales bacterium]